MDVYIVNHTDSSRYLETGGRTLPFFETTSEQRIEYSHRVLESDVLVMLTFADTTRVQEVEIHVGKAFDYIIENISVFGRVSSDEWVVEKLPPDDSCPGGITRRRFHCLSEYHQGNRLFAGKFGYSRDKRTPGDNNEVINLGNIYVRTGMHKVLSHYYGSTVRGSLKGIEIEIAVFIHVDVFMDCLRFQKTVEDFSLVTGIHCFSLNEYPSGLK